MARLYFTEDYVTEKLAHMSVKQWLNYGDIKLGTGGKDLKLVGVRNWPSRHNASLKWCRPNSFLYGKNCKQNTQQAMKEGFVELRFSYTPFNNGTY